MSKEIPLKGRDGVVRGHAIVDDSDYDWLMQWNWHLLRIGYAARSSRLSDGLDKRHMIYMHRALLDLGFGDKRQADHINMIRLDNRRSNLRLSDNSLNRQNLGLRGGTSRFRGVAWHKETNKWRAYISVNKKWIHLGLFDDEESAARASSFYRACLMPHSREGSNV